MSRDGESMQSLPPKDDAEDGESIRVYLRVRPPTARELAVGSPQAVYVEAPSVLVKSDPPRHFTYDGVMGESSTQEELFECVGKSVGSSCLAGYNGSVYVYGQTGAGKTHTMCGPIDSVESMKCNEQRGLICRMLDYIFAEVARRGTETSGLDHTCRCSFLEIYKEQITDLLEPQNTNLQVREDLTKGVYVERLSEVRVTELTEAFEVLWRGLQTRQVGSTHMNDRSSRSHAVFTLYVEAHQKRAGVTSTRVASLNLIDLAGSERQQHAGDPRSSLVQPYESLRVKEAGAINKSLSALTNVIMSLSRQERSRRRGDGARTHFVRYRDSKLTFLLRDSLGGNSKTVIVANVSPAQICVQETVSTLKFAARAKHIRCSVVRNEAFSGTMESLKEEVRMLRKQLAQLSGHCFDRSTLPANLCQTLEEPEAEDREDQPYLNQEQQVARLEVLLAAALEREQQADQRQHRLQRLANFLEDLDARKYSSWCKLHEDYVTLLPSLQASVVADDDEVQELSCKLQGISKLLGNLVQGDELASESTEAPPPEIDGTDEEAALREENRLLRRQLEDHPEVKQLRAENWLLREELWSLDPAGWPRVPTCSGLGDAVLSPPPVRAEALLRGFEENDDASSKTWFYFQKMAKEVEQLTRAKEQLIRAVEAAGNDLLQDSNREEVTVKVDLVEELDQVTSEALKQAQELLHLQNRPGAKEVDEGGSAAKEAAPDEERLQQALARITQLHSTVDMVKAAYGDAFDDFRRLREDYESRWEDCQFFELQCSRLNLTCLDLADRLVPGRGRPGGYSATGFWPSASEKQKRSFSMTSLRDASFWEQRFQELQELTGSVEDVEGPFYPGAGSMPCTVSAAHAQGRERLVTSNSLSALAGEPRPQAQYAGTHVMRRVVSAPVLVPSLVAVAPPPGARCVVRPNGNVFVAPQLATAPQERRASSVGHRTLDPRRFSDAGPLSHRASMPARTVQVTAPPGWGQVHR